MMCMQLAFYSKKQGRSRGGGGGDSGGSAEPPLQINDIHDYCYALEIMRAEMYVLYNTPTFYAHSIHT